MGTWVWITLGALAVLLLASSGKQKTGSGSGRNDRRIDHLHYIDPDEYECPKCGARFRKNVMTCPKCGVKFTGTAENDDAFIEEMVLWDDDDE